MGKNKFFTILAICLFSAIFRFYRLGEIPAGLSLTEVKIGLYFAGLFGNWVLSPLVIRLPFAIFGMVSIYLFYKLVTLIFNDQKISLVSTFVLCILPWHVTESRVFSLGIILLLMMQVVSLIFLKYFHIKKFTLGGGKVLIFTFLIILSFAVIPYKDASLNVNAKRLAVSKISPNFISRVFENKYLENLRYRQKNFFDNLDIGNYFFAGHPRERVGVEERQKLLLFCLPFLIFGLVKLKNKERLFLIVYMLFGILLITYLDIAESASLIFAPVFAVVTGIGVMASLESKGIQKYLVYCLLIFGIFELSYFYNAYIKGFTESQYSQRRPLFVSLVPEVYKNLNSSKHVLVNERVGDPYYFFRFYSKNKIEKFEFRNFDIIRSKEDGYLYVDVLPDDPSTGEPLYTKDGEWPNDLNVLAGFYDSGKRQKVVIYKLK